MQNNDKGPPGASAIRLRESTVILATRARGWPNMVRCEAVEPGE